MFPGLRIITDRNRVPLRVFYSEDSNIVTTFEDHLPPGCAIKRITSDLPPDLPARLRWNTPGYDYYAFLPKDRLFEGHLMAPLKYHKPLCVQRDSWWYADLDTCNLWMSLDAKFTKSIRVLSHGLYVELGHREPREAAAYGFLRGHKSQKNLLISLNASKHAFVHRLAYLTYIVALVYKWDTPELGDQPWRSKLVANCGSNWMDSVWAAIFAHWNARNFIGTAVRPSCGSLKWLLPAFHIGVPIWVAFPGPGCYDGQDGAHVMLNWQPTQEQVTRARTPQVVSTAPPQVDPIATHTPDQPILLTCPAIIPERAQWYESWQEFFRKRDKANKKRQKEASEKENQSWKGRAKNAENFFSPGKSGPAVYVWEECDSGGFFRVRLTHHDADLQWEDYSREGLVFDPQGNAWDYCPFMCQPVVECGVLDDMDEDDDKWLGVPDLPPTPLNDNPSTLEFLHRRYGFLAIEPTTPATATLIPDKATAHRTVGLGPPADGEAPVHLIGFISNILQRQLPVGYCDLSPDSPTNEKFPTLGISSIGRSVFQSNFLEISERTVFTLMDDPKTPLPVVVHSPLCVLQLVRVGVSLELTAAVRYLLSKGSRFTMLYTRTRPQDPPQFRILTFPARDRGWKASVQDYNAYISRLKLFFLERPHMVAAAFSRGGIAWRIALEVLGIADCLDAVLYTYPDQGSPVNTSRGRHWFHGPDEGEWFFLVGGYELLTGWPNSFLKD